LHVAAILVGANFRFGHRGQVTCDCWRNSERSTGSTLRLFRPWKLVESWCQATAIRNAIAEGAWTKLFLCSPSIFAYGGDSPRSGPRANDLVPTLNLVPEQELLPKLGCMRQSRSSEERLSIGDECGYAPTFDGKGVTVESHLFGFDERILAGRWWSVFMRGFAMSESFPADELRGQIARDIVAAQDYFAVHGKRRMIERGVHCDNARRPQPKMCARGRL